MRVDMLWNVGMRIRTNVAEKVTGWMSTRRQEHNNVRDRTRPILAETNRGNHAARRGPLVSTPWHEHI